MTTWRHADRYNGTVEYSDANMDMMLSAPRQAVLLAGGAAFRSTDGMDRDFNDRFWSKVDRSGGRFACWPWTAARQCHGYGIFGIAGRSRLAHRVAYALVCGDPPPGSVLDHLCRNRVCCNPEHLEPVSNAENILRGISPSAIHKRKTACPNGHPYSPENTVVRASGRRRCMACRENANRACRVCGACGASIHRASMTRHVGRVHRAAA